MSIKHIKSNIIMTRLLNHINSHTRASIQHRQNLHNIIQLSRALRQTFQENNTTTKVLRPPQTSRAMTITIRLQHIMSNKYSRQLISKITFLRPHRRISKLPNKTSIRTRATTILLVSRMIRKNLNLVHSNIVHNVMNSISARQRSFANTQLRNHCRRFRSKQIYNQRNTIHHLRNHIINITIRHNSSLRATFLRRLLTDLIILTRHLILRSLISRMQTRRTNIFGNQLTSKTRILRIRHVLRQHISNIFRFLFKNSMTLIIRRLRRSITLIFNFLLINFRKEVRILQVLNSYHSNHHLNRIRFQDKSIRMTFNNRFRTTRIITTRLHSIRMTLRSLNFKMFLFSLRQSRRLTRLTYRNIFHHVMFNSQVIIFANLNKRRILSMLLHRHKATLLITTSSMNLRRHSRRTLRIRTNVFRRTLIFANRSNLLRNFKSFLRQRSLTILHVRFHRDNLTIIRVRHQTLQRQNRVRVSTFSHGKQGSNFNHIVNNRRDKRGRGAHRGTTTRTWHSMYSCRYRRALGNGNLLLKRSTRSGITNLLGAYPSARIPRTIANFSRGERFLEGD